MPRRPFLQTSTLLTSVFSVLFAVVTHASPVPDDVFDGDHYHYNNRPDAGLFEPGPAYDHSGAQYESGLRKRAEEHDSDKLSPELIFAIVLACLVGVLLLVGGPLIALRRHRQRQHQERLTSTAAQVLGRNRSLSNSTMRIPQGRQPLTVFINVDTHVAGTNSMISSNSEKLGSPLVAILKSPFTRKGPRPTSSFLLPFENEKPKRGSKLHKARSPSVSPRAWSPPRPMKDEEVYKLELDFDGDVTEQEQDWHRHQQRDRDEKPVLKLTIDTPPSLPSLSLSISSRPTLNIRASATTPLEAPMSAVDTPTTAISLRAPSPGPAMTPISPVADTLSVARAVGIASATARRFTYTGDTATAEPSTVIPPVPILRQPTLPARTATNGSSRSLARDIMERNMFVRAQAFKASGDGDADVEAIGPVHQASPAASPDSPSSITSSRDTSLPSQTLSEPSNATIDCGIGIAH